MRILHSADWHIGELNGPVISGQNARLLDTLSCIDGLVQKARKEQPSVILIAGDLFDKAKLWADNMLMLIAAAEKRLRELAAIAPTVLMYGTGTHDNLQAFENIDSMRISDLYIVTEPQLFSINTYAGLLQIAAVPGLDKGYFRSKHPGMDPAEENATCSKLLGDLVLGLGAQVDPSIPSVLIGHYTVAGCEYDNGQISIFNNSEVILPSEAIAASPFDLICLGHIHRVQKVQNCGKPVFYSGPVNGLTFNEEGQAKGFWMHEIEQASLTGNKGTIYGNKYYVDSRFIETPARWFTTIKVAKDSYFDWPALFAEDPQNAMELYAREIDPCAGAITRFHYICDEETRKKLNHKAIEKALYDAGAFYVSEIKPVQINIALTKQELTENAGPLDNLAQWLEREGFSQEEIQFIVSLASPLIAAVSARIPTGKLAGVFIPRQLEVKNYRSYRDETFNFNQITFATVNGPNGVGKSAFFMDSISDCLFEETREGEITGWITSGEKSGMITFEFSMGESIWRVIRTRARSGKTTLALQELVEDGSAEPWKNRGAERKDDTQEKIIALLGMDALTFRCCGLIMQDAYGLFLEADREDRMQVLGNILGLGLYEQLEKLAKDKVTETNRELETSKRRLAELNEKLKAKPELQKELTESETELAETVKNIADKEAELKETELVVQALQAKALKAEELRKQVVALEGELDTKKKERETEQERLKKASEFLSREPEILVMVAMRDNTKEQVAVLKAKQPRVIELGNEENRLSDERAKTDVALGRLEKQIKEAEDFLKDKERINKSAAEYREAQQSLKNIEDLGKKHHDLYEKVMAIERQTDKIAEPLSGKYEQLKNCLEKVEILNNSNCIDPQKASCHFLEDAFTAKSLIPQIEAEIKEILDKRRPLDEQVQAIEAESDSLGYDREEHYRLKLLAEKLQPFSEKAAQLNAKSQLLENLLMQKKNLAEQKTKLNERLVSVRVQKETLQQELKPLAGMEERLPKLDAWVKAKDDLPAKRQIVIAAKERIAAVNKEIKAKERQVMELEKERDALMDSVITLSGNQLDQNKAKVVDLQTAIKKLQEQQNKLHSQQGGIKAKLEALAKDEEQCRQVTDQMAPLAVTLTRYQTLVKAFGYDGIPFSIVRAVVPEFSALANDILGQMTGGKMSLEMRTERIQKSNKKEVNALEIWITDYLHGSLPYRSRSGGQKVKAALSVAFALADLKARRAGIQLGMLAVDEPPFLDGEGAEAYCDALELISQRYQDMKVIAISHDPMMKARFPQWIDVIETDQGSKVVMVA